MIIKFKPTKDVMQEFLESCVPPEAVDKIAAQIDRPEVYTYEEKLQKQIFYMDKDEVFELLKLFRRGKQKDSSFLLSYGSYDLIVAYYRKLWHYYATHYEPIINVWDDRSMRPSAVARRFVDEYSRPVVSYKSLKELFDEMDEANAKHPYVNYHKYIQCIALMFYNGFATCEEIVTLQRDMIDFSTRTITLPNRQIVISQECMNLMQYVHSLDYVRSLRVTNPLVSYRGGYFKIAVREGTIDTIDEKTPVDAGIIIARKLNINLRHKFEVDVTPRVLFLRGFYDHLIEKYGEDNIKKIMRAKSYDPKVAQEIVDYALSYGLYDRNFTNLRRTLRGFY